MNRMGNVEWMGLWETVKRVKHVCRKMIFSMWGCFDSDWKFGKCDPFFSTPFKFQLSY